MGYFKELEEEVSKYLEPDQILAISQAYRVARDAHHGQKRVSGEAYITHPVAAATLLAQLRLDQQSIMAALLHDVLEDTKITKEELIEQFGSEVADLVDGTSKLMQIKFESRAEAQAENFRKMMLAMVKDIRVILIKLADRLHNMRTLGVMPPEKKRRIAIETLDIYAPIANRLGMHSMRIELEDLGFKALYPKRYSVLKKAVDKAVGNRRSIVQQIEEDLASSLAKHNVNIVRVFGRQKHLYSIYKKMQHKSASFSEIMDVHGFRIVASNIDNCYRALGVVHNLYKPKPERFKDYIAIPKANGYQSLHTTLFGPYGMPIEVQIRSKDMEKIAENGIAAHWLYKSDPNVEADESQLRAREWIKTLLDMQQSSGSSLEFIESVKIDLFPDEVYVFTPQGDIMELPRGATPVDFAYAVHSDIGNACVAARVDRRLAPLSMPLSNGQTVEVITAPGAQPNPAWLNFIVTGKARSNIRHFLKDQQRAQSCVFGKRLLMHALNELSSDLEAIAEEDLVAVLSDLHYDKPADLYSAIGLGIEVAPVVARRMMNKIGKGDLISDSENPAKPLTIKGTEGMVVHYANCCRPIPGDPILGYLTPGHGINVHHEQCEKIMQLQKRHSERVVFLCWEEEVRGEFKVDVLIEVVNQRGMLALLASAIADAEANIDNISVDPGDGHYYQVTLTMTVRNRQHLARVLRRIRSLKPVTRLTRLR